MKLNPKHTMKYWGVVYLAGALAAAAFMWFAAPAKAQDNILLVSFSGLVWNIDLNAACTKRSGVYEPNGLRVRYKAEPNGDLVFGQGIFLANSVTYPSVCPTYVVAVTTRSGGGKRYTATDHEKSAGKGGQLAAGEETTQAGGTTTGGNGAPPAVGGNYP